MRSYDPREFFDAGFAKFLKHEHDLVVSGVSERSLCARLMLHLEAVKDQFGFGQYVVDVDYNRMGRQSVKYMLKQGGLVQIEADLLVHRRGVPDNLIALEMKKWEAVPAKKELDRIRLQVLTLSLTRAQEAVVALEGPLRPEHVGGYELGLFLIVNPQRQFVDMEEYRGGELVTQARVCF